MKDEKDKKNDEENYSSGIDSIAYTPVREQLLSTAPATFPDSSVHPQTMMEFSRSWVSSNIRQNY